MNTTQLLAFCLLALPLAAQEKVEPPAASDSGRVVITHTVEVERNGRTETHRYRRVFLGGKTTIEEGDAGAVLRLLLVPQRNPQSAATTSQGSFSFALEDRDDSGLPLIGVVTKRGLLPLPLSNDASTSGPQHYRLQVEGQTARFSATGASFAWATDKPSPTISGAPGARPDLPCLASPTPKHQRAHLNLLLPLPGRLSLRVGAANPESPGAFPLDSTPPRVRAPLAPSLSLFAPVPSPTDPPAQSDSGLAGEIRVLKRRLGAIELRLREMQRDQRP